MKWVSPVVGILLVLWGPAVYGPLVMMQANAKLEGYKRIYNHERDFVRGLCQLYADFAGLYSGTTAALIGALYYAVAVGQTTLWKSIALAPISVLALVLVIYTWKFISSKDMVDYVDRARRTGPKHALKWFRIGVAVYALVLAVANQWGK